ncbi:membrane-associated protein, putative [Bodo saltans]|uniref:Membrane-associated protein, putative n=1 Tax=Bodo saltans TaxID=75058 RepID=A0A0S4JAH3_BODSA|nr:membrane-associated protein, putative [Bodo saltans]|eukprot:CUG86452.1 membrane-associated protein, putative [Bodo saltans]
MLSLITSLLWVYALGSWCMCFYVLFASCEGARWFSARRNPLLIAGAVGGFAATAWQLNSPPCSSVAVTCLGWTAYSALVTMQHGKFLLWSRHILPVNAPTVALLWWFGEHC